METEKDPIDSGGEEEKEPIDPSPPKESEEPACTCSEVDDDTFEKLLDSIFDEGEPPEVEESDPCPCDCDVSDESVEDLIKEVFDEPPEDPPEELPPDEPPEDPPEEPPCKPSPPPSTIMNDVKKFCGVFADYEVFDVDFMMNINAAFFTLFELGVGPKGGFVIEDNKTPWSAFMDGVEVEEDREKIVLAAVKQYVFLKVRKTFDPPTSSYVLKSIDDQIAEFEWRLRELCSGYLDPDNGEDEEGEPCDCDSPEEPPEDEDPDEPSDDPSEEPSEECSCPYETATDEEVDSMLVSVFGEEESDAEGKDENSK